MIIKQKKKHQN